MILRKEDNIIENLIDPSHSNAYESITRNPFKSRPGSHSVDIGRDTPHATWPAPGTIVRPGDPVARRPGEPVSRVPAPGAGRGGRVRERVLSRSASSGASRGACTPSKPAAPSPPHLLHNALGEYEYSVWYILCLFTDRYVYVRWEWVRYVYAVSRCVHLKKQFSFVFCFLRKHSGNACSVCVTQLY